MKENEMFSKQYLLDRNTINIFGTIDTLMADEVISALLYLDYKGAEEITIQINSPGGCVTDALGIRNTMNYVKAKIITVGIGQASSAGALLLSSGSKGYRRALEDCEVMIHQPLGGISGQASEIINAAEHIKKVRDRLNLILSENTGKDIKTIEKDTDRDYVLSALEAKEYGLIDEVIVCKNKAKED